MSHGFAGYVMSLSPADQEAFKKEVFTILSDMQLNGGLTYVRTAMATAGYKH
jgi:hypothetical protein